MSFKQIPGVSPASTDDGTRLSHGCPEGRCDVRSVVTEEKGEAQTVGPWPFVKRGALA